MDEKTVISGGRDEDGSYFLTWNGDLDRVRAEKKAFYSARRMVKDGYLYPTYEDYIKDK